MPVRGDTTERRWERAHRIAAGRPDPAVRRAFRSRMAILIGAALLIGATPGVIGAVFGHRHRRPVRHVAQHQATGVLLVVAIDLLAVGLLLILAGLVQTVRWLRPRRQQPRLLDSPLLALKYRERRRVLRQINGKDSADAGILDITRHVAARLRSQHRPSAVLFAGLAVLFLGDAVLIPSAGEYFVAGLCTVMAVTALPVAGLPARRATRFLSQNPGADADIAG